MKHTKTQVASKAFAAIEKQQAAWVSAKEQARNVGIKDMYKRQRNWKKKCQDWIKKTANQKHDIVQENTLIFLNLGLLYLDFVDACQKKYSVCVEKCI